MLGAPVVRKDNNFLLEAGRDGKKRGVESGVVLVLSKRRGETEIRTT